MATDLYDLLVKQKIMTQAQADAARAAAAAAAAAGKGTKSVTTPKPTSNKYPTIFSPTAATAFINKIFQENLNRDASAAELKYWKPLLKVAQTTNAATQKYKVVDKVGVQTSVTGLDEDQWLKDQLTNNTDYKKILKNIDYAAEINTIKITDPKYLARQEEKKIYTEAIAAAAGDPAKIATLNETTTYGRGITDLLSIIQNLAEGSAATNTPEELSALATKLYDKGISASSAEAVTEINNAFKSGSILVKYKAPDLVTLAVNKKIYEDLIIQAGNDPAKIAEVNETTEYGIGLSNLATAIELKASDLGAINTPKELNTLAKTLYDKGILLASPEGIKAIDAVLKNDKGLIKGQPADLVTLAANKKIYDAAITAAAGDAVKIEAATKNTVYGRGLKEMLSLIQATANIDGATNTPEDLSALAAKLYNQGLSFNSAEASAEIDKTLVIGTILIKDKAASLKILAANKKIYDDLIAKAGTDPAKIAAANENTEYGRGLSSIIAALKTKAKGSSATNTPEELTALATELFNKGLTLDSPEGIAAIDAAFTTGTGLVSDTAVDLEARLADKKIYDRLIKEAGNDPAKIAAANETTEYGRGLKDIVTALQNKAKGLNATNTVEELTALATKLFNQGLTLESAEGIAAVNAALKTDIGLVTEAPADLVQLAADKKIYEKLIVAAKGDPKKIAAANDNTAYGRGLKEIIAALQTKAKDSGAINTPKELNALAQKLYDKGISLFSSEGIAAVDAILKNKNGLVKDQPADLLKIASDKKTYDGLIAAALGDPALIAQAKKNTAYGRGITALEASLQSNLFQSGATNTAEEITALAKELYDSGINPASDEGLAKINKIRKYTPDAKTGKYSGTAGTTIAELQATAVANGLDLQKNFGNQISGWLSAISNGEQINNIKQKIRDVAKLGQPESIKKLIDNGGDLESIYAPYKNTMASVLEIQDPNSIKLEDPTLRMAISPTGELNLFDYKRALRKDNRWQYTQQAKTEVASATKRVLQDFGFMG